jgi:subtilisin family serine protease
MTHNLLALSAIAGLGATTSGCLPEYHLRIDVGQPDAGFSIDKPSMAATNDIDDLRDIVDQFGTVNVLVTSSVDAKGRLAWRDVILRDVLSSGTSYTRRTYDHLSVLSLEVDREALDRLAASDEVESLTLNIPSPLNTLQHANVVGATRTQKFGLGGAGQTIVIADSGVDASHPLLSGHVIDGACFSTDSASSTSLCPSGASEAYGIDAGGACEEDIAGCDHGTHVAGIGRTIAPESSLISVQVFSEFDAECATYGLASPCVLTWQDDLLAALDYVVDLSQTDPSIASLNMSLGGGVFSGACDDDPRAEGIKMLRDLGVTTVVAAGNDGSADGVSAPGCISAALTVGATSFTDEVSSFSNGGHLVDILAPGESILSTVPGGIDRMSGTSMAAPHVAASIAVLRSVSPDLTVDEIETLLKATGQPVSDSRSGLVHPRLQLDASAYRVYTSN